MIDAKKSPVIAGLGGCQKHPRMSDHGSDLQKVMQAFFEKNHDFFKKFLTR